MIDPRPVADSNRCWAAALLAACLVLPGCGGSGGGAASPGGSTEVPAAKPKADPKAPAAVDPNKKVLPWDGVPRPAPDFEFTGIKGPKMKLSRLRGQVVIIKFWATWCGDCIREMPYTKQLYERFAPKGVAVLGVSTDTKVGPDKVLEVARQHGNNYPVMIQDKEGPGKVSEVYGLDWLPTVLVIDRKGKVRHVAKDLEGPHLEEFAAVVETLLAEPK